MNPHPRADVSTGDLVKEAIGQTSALAKSEIDLAKDDLRRTAEKAALSAAVLGLSALAGIAGIEVLSVAYVLKNRARPGRSIAMGLGLLALATAGGVAASLLLPKQPLGETPKRLERDLSAIKEQIL